MKSDNILLFSDGAVKIGESALNLPRVMTAS